MSLTNFILTFLGSSITVYVELLAYSKISNNKLVYNFKNILLLLLSGLIVTINIMFSSNGIIRTFISFLILLTASNLIFENRFSKCLFYTIICFIVGMFFEVILSVLVLNIVSYDEFENSIIIKTLFSFLTIIMTYLFLSNKYIIKLVNKLSNKLSIRYIQNIIFIVFLVVLFIADYRYISTFSKEIYISNIIIIFSLLLLLIVNLYNNFKIIKEIQKTDTLLKFITKYEIIIDEDRINRHEMLNNLLSLKTIKNKNSKKYDKYLDDLIDTYNNNGVSIKNIYKLPSGLKGIFYYKLIELQNKEYSLNVNISKSIDNEFKNINEHDYIVLCKMVGILLDNAIEATKESKDKYLGIDVYKENNNIIVQIDNTFMGTIDINNINNKNFSTKGKNRGLGLYILNNIVNKTKNIELTQDIANNIFSSRITIKKE